MASHLPDDNHDYRHGVFESEDFLGINFEIFVKVGVKAVFVGKFVGKFVGERWGSGGFVVDGVARVEVRWWIGW